MDMGNQRTNRTREERLFWQPQECDFFAYPYRYSMVGSELKIEKSKAYLKPRIPGGICDGVFS